MEKSIIYVKVTVSQKHFVSKLVANIYTCTRPHPLYHARTPATSDSASGQYVDDIILAGVS